MNILCFGDSNTFGISPLDGKRLSEYERFPTLLKQQLAEQCHVIEAGQPNRTLVKNLAFTGDKSGIKYLKPYLEEHKLDAIIIQLGTNDLKARFALTPKQIAEGLEQLIMSIKAFYRQVINHELSHQKQKNQKPSNQPLIIILSPPKVFEVGQYQKVYKDAEQKSKALGLHFMQVAKKYGCEFLDCYPLVEPCKSEGIHIPKSGHKKLANELYKLLST